MKKGLIYYNKTAEHDTTASQSPKRITWTCARLAVKELSKIVAISLSWGMCSFLVAKQPCCELQCGRRGNVICRAERSAALCSLFLSHMRVRVKNCHVYWLGCVAQFLNTFFWRFFSVIEMLGMLPEQIGEPLMKTAIDKFLQTRSE